MLAQPLAAVFLARGGVPADRTALLAAMLTVTALALPADALQRALLAPFFRPPRPGPRSATSCSGWPSTWRCCRCLVLPFAPRPSAVVAIGASYVVANWVQVVHAAYRLRSTSGVLPLPGPASRAPWRSCWPAPWGPPCSSLALVPVPAQGGVGPLLLRLVVAGSAAVLVLGGLGAGIPSLRRSLRLPRHPPPAGDATPACPRPPCSPSPATPVASGDQP